MPTGKVKWFDPKKGYGFILGDQGEDVFVHYTNIMGDGFRTLKDGETVSYELVKTEKGHQAHSVAHPSGAEGGGAPRPIRPLRPPCSDRGQHVAAQGASRAQPPVGPVAARNQSPDPGTTRRWSSGRAGCRIAVYAVAVCAHRRAGRGTCGGPADPAACAVCAVRARELAAQARTQQHLVELAKLTGGLAHEIKNPLSTVKLNLKLLAEDFSESQDDLYRRNYNRLVRVQDEVQRMHDILADFLKYAGDQELQLKPADLRQVVEELMDFFRPQAESNHVVMRCSLPEAPVACRMDAGLIKQAILNLMINATQAMVDGGELLLRLSSSPGRAVLEVIDTGPGIDAEVRERMFEAYYSTRPGGSGFGLPTTRRIIHQHDGEITVDGEPGKGTRFVLSLPLAQPG